MIALSSLAVVLNASLAPQLAQPLHYAVTEWQVVDCWGTSGSSATMNAELYQPPPTMPIGCDV